MEGATPQYNRSHALVIGINRYEDCPRLGYAVNDAEAVADALTTNFGFDSQDVHLLLDSDATRTKIHKEFLTFCRDGTHIDDRVLVFFAGHGHTEPYRDGQIGYLVPADGDPNDLSSLLRWDTITRDAALIEAKHVFFVMDACYGGLAITRSLQPGSSRFLKNMLQRYARQVLTAGKADEVVADLGGPRPHHSVFTGHFLDALDGAVAGASVLTANGVMAYVYRNVSVDPSSEQTPHFGYLKGDGDFVFNPPSMDNIDTNPVKETDVLIPIPGTATMESFDFPTPPPDKVKTLLTNESNKILLRDFVVQQIRATLSALSTDAFKTQGSWSNEEFAERLAKYNDAMSDLRAIQMLLGYWGAEYHQDIIQLAPKRLAEQIGLDSGLRVWLSLRWYPVLLLVYSCGLGAVASNRYANLKAVLHARLPDPRQHRSTTTLAQSLFGDFFSDVAEAFKTLPGHERQYVPVSEYLFKELQPLADDILFLGAEYEQTFDRVEILLSLECASIERGWGPIGRFGWKHSSRRGIGSPLEDLIQEAEAAHDEWPPLQAGFFGGSFEKFSETVASYKPMIDSLHWF